MKLQVTFSQAQKLFEDGEGDNLQCYYDTKVSTAETKIVRRRQHNISMDAKISLNINGNRKLPIRGGTLDLWLNYLEPLFDNDPTKIVIYEKLVKAFAKFKKKSKVSVSGISKMFTEYHVLREMD